MLLRVLRITTETIKPNIVTQDTLYTFALSSATLPPKSSEFCPQTVKVCSARNAIKNTLFYDGYRG